MVLKDVCGIKGEREDWIGLLEAVCTTEIMMPTAPICNENKRGTGQQNHYQENTKQNPEVFLGNQF